MGGEWGGPSSHGGGRNPSSRADLLSFLFVSWGAGWRVERGGERLSVLETRETWLKRGTSILSIANVEAKIRGLSCAEDYICLSLGVCTVLQSMSDSSWLSRGER